eukprot:g26996.t1
MIAIPDFSAGAMENWGLVTYREVALLCEEQTVSATQKQRICTVIAHELAHQWFGNLVTMEWWDDLWLNEGFANWMQTFCSDRLYPDWHIWDSRRTRFRMELSLSFFLVVPIAKAEQVEEVFDAISYCKGGSVVRMIYRVLGDEHFQKGLQLYFSRHKYGNTRTIDLWNAWKEVLGKPIDKMMSSWTEQMGFPLLEVLNDPFTSNQVELKQSWFLADGSKETNDDAKVWFCPVIVGTDKGEAPVSFLEEKTGKIPCDLSGASVLKVNFGQHVPVRVLYPEKVFMRLHAQRLRVSNDFVQLSEASFPGFPMKSTDGSHPANVWSGNVQHIAPSQPAAAPSTAAKAPASALDSCAAHICEPVDSNGEHKCQLSQNAIASILSSPSLMPCHGYDIAGTREGKKRCPHAPGICLKDCQLYLGTCFKKCSVLTNGAFPHRKAFATCCKAESLFQCLMPGEAKTDQAFAEGGGFGHSEGSDICSNAKRVVCE